MTRPGFDPATSRSRSGRSNRGRKAIKQNEDKIGLAMILDVQVTQMTVQVCESVSELRSLALLKITATQS